MSISEKSVENILTDDAINTTPNPRYKPITNIFSFLRETVLTRALRHRRWKRLEFSRSLLFKDLESTGIELHGGMRDCPYGGNLLTKKLSAGTETDTLGDIGLFGGSKSRLPHKIEKHLWHPE